jgi:hypothetical protein
VGERVGLADVAGDRDPVLPWEATAEIRGVLLLLFIVQTVERTRGA